MGRFESRIWPGASSTGPSRSSSPVDSTPTRGPGHDQHLGGPEARDHPEVRGPEHDARLEDPIAGLHVAARGAEMVARGRGVR